ncbi:MAG: hypothetical protein O3A07_06920 [Bacteroidetes bacterium]|nr:hypothetical protein [Bacteroidota bacterium]
MNDKVRFVIEIISVLAIVLSLVFLGLEVNQSNTLAKASIRQSLNETDMDVYEMRMDKEAITRAHYKIDTDLPLDDYEQYMMIQFQTFNFRDFDNSFYQYRLGLFDENNWQAYRRIIKKLLEDRYVRIMLENNMSDFSTEFQNELKSIKED